MTSKILVIAAILVALTGTVFAQQAISVKSGLINNIEGQVLLNDKVLVTKVGVLLPSMEEKGVLKTEDGRAEVLLTPGIFLRQAENSQIRLITNRLIDVRLEVISGEVLIEVAELLKDNHVTLVAKDAEIALRKPGVYRIDVQDSARLRVYEGEASVAMAGQTLGVTKGKQVALGGVLVAQKFNTKETDALYRWAARRDEYVAVANLSAAKSIRDRGLGWGTSGWYYNSYFGMYTYVPYSGAWNSFLCGNGFYSPNHVHRIYYPPQQSAGWSDGNRGSYHPDLGYSTGSQTASGNSGAMAVSSSAPTTSTSSATAPVSHGATSGGGRGR